jgi:hypothetical protein
VNEVRSESETCLTAWKYSGSCSERTVVIAPELHKLFLQRLEDGVKGVNRGLVRCVLLIELDCFFGRHGVVFD